MPITKVRYTAIAKNFVSQNPSLKIIGEKRKHIDGKYLIYALYDYIINSNDKEVEFAKNLFIKYHITPKYMEKVTRKMFKLLEKNFVINNRTFVPGFGFYGLRILKNKKNFYIWHIYVEHYTKNEKIKKKKVMIIPKYDLYVKAFKNLLKNPIYR